jgi:hypothetical protein
MNCFVVFIIKYRNTFLVYLPQINNVVNKYKIVNTQYKDCIGFLMNYGNLEDIYLLIDRNDDNGLFQSISMNGSQSLAN